MLTSSTSREKRFVYLQLLVELFGKYWPEMMALVIVNIDNAFNIVISIKLGQFEPCNFYKFKFLTSFEARISNIHGTKTQ